MNNESSSEPIIDPNKRYAIIPYDGIASFTDELKKHLKFTELPFEYQKKYLIIYLKEYLEKIKPSLLVFEYKYVDQGYLDDHAEFYVRCFSPYERMCIRVHFFKDVSMEDLEFDKLFDKSIREIREFEEYLAKNKLYLGFIVIKRIPDVFFGRTCLATYPEKVGNEKTKQNESRFYLTKNNPVCLFGLELNIKSIPYQEQDLTVSCCATNAIWSALHQTSEYFTNWAPALVDITKFATSKLSSPGRALPNRGLNLIQICDAINAVGLDSEVLNFEDDEFIDIEDLKGPLYAYLTADIPVIMSLWLVTPYKKKLKDKGRHAVTITGYRKDNNIIPESITGFLSSASCLRKLYAHDDQIGPYARMEIKEDHLATSWEDDDGSYLAIPMAIVMPVDKLIRIRHSDIKPGIEYFDYIFEECVRPKINESNPIDETKIDRLIWDIYLTDVTSLKNDILEDEIIDPSLRKELLFTNMPKYIWVAIGRSNDCPIIKILFDATDFSHGNLILHIIQYFAEYTNEPLLLINNDHEMKEYFSKEMDHVVSRIFTWLQEHNTNNQS